MHYFRWPVVWITLLFLLTGAVFLRKAGMHYDASYELACFYPCSIPAYRPTVFHHWIPLMIIQYLGALKAWLYLPILEFLEVTPLVVRLPYLLGGAASVALFFAILDRVSGRRTAIAGALLLATDASFLLATCYDFGPIMLLHLSLLGGIVLLLRFEATRQTKYLALAFLVFGLAFWHKALFVWMFGGLVAASLAVFPKRILKLVTPARVALAAFCLCLGAAPLIYYNVVTRGATLHPGRVSSEIAPLSQKLLILRKTMDGSILFGWLTEDAQPETVLPPRGIVQRTSVKLSAATGSVQSNWMLYAFLAACCLVPWLLYTPSRRAALFALVYLAVAWGQMAILPSTGGSLHHVLLLWPIPHLLIAVAGVELAARLGRYGARLLAVALVALVGCNALVINHYYADLVTRGTSVIWTDAVNPLYTALDSLRGQQVVAVDWGYSTTLCLFSDGDMPLRDISTILLQPSPAETSFIRSLLADRNTIFVDHTPGGEQFPGVRERLAQIAAAAGYTKVVIETIADRNRRPRFELSRYRGLR